MVPEITMRELIIIVLCFVIYIVAVEVYEAKVIVNSQAELVQQEQSFTYVAPDPPESGDETATIVTGMEETGTE